MLKHVQSSKSYQYTRIMFTTYINIFLEKRDTLGAIYLSKLVTLVSMETLTAYTNKFSIFPNRITEMVKYNYFAFNQLNSANFISDPFTN